MQVVLLMGPPGSGKGTIAAEVQKKLNIKHLSTGDMLRDEVNSNTELGKKIKDIMANGVLISDEIMSKLIDKQISSDSCKNGVVLDGYPRTINQAKNLDEVFVKLNIKEYKVVELEVNQDILIKRILGRYMCTKCSKIYNEYFAPTLKLGVCDVCGSTEFIRRKDDNLEVIKDRLEIYNKQTTPVLDYYKTNNRYYVINGEEEITSSVNNIINLLA